MLYNALPSITSFSQASKNVNCAEPEVKHAKKRSCDICDRAHLLCDLGVGLSVTYYSDNK